MTLNSMANSIHGYLCFVDKQISGQHLLLLHRQEVKCGAEGQPLVSDFSQRKLMVRGEAGQAWRET